MLKQHNGECVVVKTSSQNKKAQAAMEFLTTYAWAIMIILLTFGALVYFGLADPKGLHYNECTLWPEFTCEQYKVSTDGTIYLQIRNNLDDLSNITLEITTNDCTLADSTYTESNVLQNRRLNKTFETVSFSCLEPLGAQEKFSADLRLTYVEKHDVTNHSVIGVMQTLVE